MHDHRHGGPGPGHRSDAHEEAPHGRGGRRFARREDWLSDDPGHRHGPGHGHGPRHGPGHGRGEGRGRHGARSLEHGDLRYLVLDLIAAKPRHGYEIIKAIEEAAGGAYSPSPGVIYPTLTLLAELGHAEAAEESGGRKLYTLTDAGRAYLDENAAALRAVQGRIAEMRASRAEEPPPAILRAMENLKVALRLRLAGGTPDGEAARRIAAAIDAAALAVEQA